MGVLDDLRKEAEQLAAPEARDKDSGDAALQAARERIEPRMQELYRYFSEFKKHLEASRREILADYEIREIGRVDGLKQGHYRLLTERPDRIGKFSLRFVRAKSGSIQVERHNATATTAYREYLRENGMRAKMREAGPDATTFLVQPAVRVVVEFSADYARLLINLRLRNLNAIGVTHHSLRVEAVDEKLLDELAKTVMCVPNRFDVLVGSALSQTGKVRLKKKLHSHVRQQQLEEELARLRAVREGSIAERVGRSLFGKKD